MHPLHAIGGDRHLRHMQACAKYGASYRAERLTAPAAVAPVSRATVLVLAAPLASQSGPDGRRLGTARASRNVHRPPRETLRAI